MIIPAIDIINGQCVRLLRGDYEAKTTYYDDPLIAAQQFQQAGCQWLHMVDLDGAKMNKPANLDVLRRVREHTTLHIEYGGGIKSSESVEQVLTAGANRVICGSIAITQPELFRSWLQTYGGGRIVLGADCRNGKIATHGWLHQTDTEVDDLIGSFIAYGLQHVIVTDIARDGTMLGPNISLYRQLQTRFPNLNIIASGGIGCNEDINNCYKAGIQYIIAGKAIYEGRIDLC